MVDISGKMFAVSMLSILLITIAFGYGRASRTVTKVLNVTNGGQWGDWETTVYCPPELYATGYRMAVGNTYLQKEKNNFYFILFHFQNVIYIQFFFFEL